MKADSVLRIQDLCMYFGGVKAVDGLSFEVKPGEIFGLIGPNGAGKTTVFNCITQFYKPTSGQLLFQGEAGGEIDLCKKKVHEVIDLGIVRTFQNVEVIRELTVLENLLIAGHRQFQASLATQALHLPRLKREEKRIREKAEKVLDDKEALIGSDKMRELERIILLRNVDLKWMDHIDAMDELRKGMGLRSYGQHNPYDTYRTEGFAMFDEMVDAIRQDTARMLISTKVKTAGGEEVKRERVAKITGTSGGGEESITRQPIRRKKIGRNEPCPCGSGKKYKNCHGRPGAEPLDNFFKQ